jgi:hypothetical protein
MKFKPVVALLLALSMLGCNNGTDAVAAGTFGSLLDDLSNQVNLFIQHAQNTGLILEVNGGAQVANLITQAKDAYKSSLNTTVSQMTGEQQKLVSDINATFEKVQGGIADVNGDILTIINTLSPFEKVPQVTTYSGVIVSPADSSGATVQLTGNFADVSKSGYEAVLKIGDSIYKPIEKLNQEIKFSIPAAEFSATANKINYKPFSINIDYSKKSLLVFSNKNTATFNLYFVILPPKFGTYVLETKKLVDTFDSLWTTCGPLDWNTHDNNDHDENQGCPVEPGWTVETDSIYLEFTRKENTEGVDWFNRGNVSTTTWVGWHFYATTRHHTFGLPTGNYGGVAVIIHYKKLKPTQKIQPTKTPETPIQWGDQKVLFLEPGITSWMITFHTFDGKETEIASSTQQNPYIKVTTAGNQLQLKLAPFGF